MEKYCSEHPEYQPRVVKTFLSKAEQRIKDKVDGKPEKPPRYFCRFFSASNSRLVTEHVIGRMAARFVDDWIACTTFALVKFKAAVLCSSTNIFCWQKAVFVLRKVVDGLRFNCGQYGSFVVHLRFSCGCRTAENHGLDRISEKVVLGSGGALQSGAVDNLTTLMPYGVPSVPDLM